MEHERSLVKLDSPQQYCGRHKLVDGTTESRAIAREGCARFEPKVGLLPVGLDRTSSFAAQAKNRKPCKKLSLVVLVLPVNFNKIRVNFPMGASDTETIKTVSYRFTGHDTFHCRYAWLPKAVQLVESDNLLFSNDDKAMVEIGVGKNMVQSIQFWAETTGVIEPVQSSRGFRPSNFGRLVLQKYDPYLENEQTLWLLHWKIATNSQPLFAWDFLLNYWHRRDFVKTEVIDAFQKEIQKQDRKLSVSTLETHFEIFLHSYIPTKSRKGEVLEDNLDCPLVELRLLTSAEDRVSKDGNRREPAYSYRIDEKNEISDELFIYCLNDFWNSKKSGDKTLNFRSISVEPGSPGQIFKINEKSIRDRLDRIEAESNGGFVFDDTAVLQQVRRTRTPSSEMLLERIYRRNNRNN